MSQFAKLQAAGKVEGVTGSTGCSSSLPQQHRDLYLDHKTEESEKIIPRGDRRALFIREEPEGIPPGEVVRDKLPRTAPPIQVFSVAIALEGVSLRPPSPKVSKTPI